MGRCYKDLIVWQKAMDLVTDIYRETAQFPHSELYGLSSQVRRAAVSVPSNIAEGQGRLSENEFRHFLGLARGSLMEVETQLQIAENLGYLQRDRCAKLQTETGEVGKILNGLIAKIGHK